MSLKWLNWLEKVLLILAFLSLASNYSFITVALAQKSYISDPIHLLTKIPQESLVGMVRTVSNVFDRASLDVAFFFVLLILLLQRGFLAKFLKTLWATGLLALLLFACASWFWSIAPYNTLTGLSLVIKMTVLGIYLSQRYSVEENLDILVSVLALISIFSILAIWLVPEQATHPGGEWRGIFIAKNFLGRMMALTNILAILYWLTHAIVWRRIFSVALFMLSGTLLFFSASATSLIVVLAGYSGFVLYFVWTKWIVRLNPRQRWPVIALGIIIASIALLNVDRILALFKKTSTLTGRTALWEILWGWFQKKPILGFGYEAFWPQFPDGIKPVGPGWEDAAAHHAHNGYFDVALALGAVGLLLFLVTLALSWKNVFTLLWCTKQVIWLWPFFALFYLTISNITYSIAFALPDFHWALFVIISGLLANNQPETPTVSAAPSPTPSQPITETI